MTLSLFLTRACVRLGILVMFVACASAQDAFVGSVKTVVGKPVVIRGAETLPVTSGMHLNLKDTLQTDSASRVGFILRDGMRVSLGPDSELAVETFLFEPGKGELGLLLRVFRGVVAFVSGKIAELSPESANVATPVGMIGLRGTKFAVSLAVK